MSTLTETSLLYCLTDIPEDNNKNEDDNRELFNAIYVCLEKKGNPHHVNGFDCYKFNNISSVKKYLKNIDTKENKKTRQLSCTCL